MKIPVNAEAIIADTRGFFNLISTPYNAGSVTDNKAVTPVEIPVSLFSAFFALKPTASAAPAIARLAAKALENNSEEPTVEISLIISGVIIVCIPTITSNG